MQGVIGNRSEEGKPLFDRPLQNKYEKIVEIYFSKYMWSQ